MSKERDPVDLQLENWKKCQKQNKDETSKFTTTSSGVPLPSDDKALSIGKYGPIVLRDFRLQEKLAHFNRERIPERVVHAKGAGARGVFRVTHDITQYTACKVFEKVGKETEVMMRFSQVAGNLGSNDTVRDPRGFAIKFYTDDGIWDLVGNNTPIFFMRDPTLFPMFIHSQKRNPVTNLRDWDMFWDYLTLRPESTHQVMFLFSDRGIPDGHRHMHGYGSHTFSMINKDQEVFWVKFHFKTNQGIQNLLVDDANKIAGEDPDYALRDLYNAIANANYPSWSLKIQVMTQDQYKNLKWDFSPFDITKTWPYADFPLIDVGSLTLNRNPDNYFAEIEQLAFSPSNIVPGISYSPDPLLQGRLFSYPDTHRYRLGVNFEQIPVNCPFQLPQNYQRDGLHADNNQGGAPVYHPNSFSGPEVDPDVAQLWPKPDQFTGTEDYFDLADDDNFSQPAIFWNKVLTDDKKDILVNNLGNSIKLASKDIQNRAVDMFSKVNQDLGNRIKALLRRSK